MRSATELLSAIRAIDVAAVSPAIRSELARRWADDALDEHASIASFARFSLQLLAVGAPPDLVAGSHAAALDEIGHARCSFAVASRYAGEPFGPGPLDGATSERHQVSLDELVRATTREGCVGETTAAAIAAAERDACTIEPVRELLAIIARDEARHAALAWRFVRWAIATGGEPIERAFDDELRRARPSSPADVVGDDGQGGPLATFGRLDRHARARIAAAIGERIAIEVAVLLESPERVIGGWIGAAP